MELFMSLYVIAFHCVVESRLSKGWTEKGYVTVKNRSYSGRFYRNRRVIANKNQ